MLSDLFSVRPLKKEDLKMVLTWRNSEKIHSVMLTDHKITWEEHCNWFEKVSRNVPCRNLIFEYRNNPIGYIGYTNYDDEGKKCSPGAYIGVDYNVPIDAGINLFYAAYSNAKHFSSSSAANEITESTLQYSLFFASFILTVTRSMSPTQNPP